MPDEAAGPVRAAPVRLHQVILNPVVNAVDAIMAATVDAIQGRGKIPVRSGIRALSEEESRLP